MMVVHKSVPVWVVKKLSNARLKPVTSGLNASHLQFWTTMSGDGGHTYTRTVKIAEWLLNATSFSSHLMLVAEHALTRKRFDERSRVAWAFSQKFLQYLIATH
jgi:hypothetical protein